MKQIENLPNHIAIIPDGNRRWAKKNHLEAWLGHKKGTESLDSMADVAIKLGIKHLSFWGSSKDNLKKRPAMEVKFLLNLFKENFLTLSKNEKVHKNKIKINVFGSWREQFPDEVKKSIEQALAVTKDYSNHFLNFFIAYSGTGELLDAIRQMTEKVRTGEPLDVNGEAIKNYLLTRDLPPVDLMIRTGGEPHLSDGFMMWDTANAQLYFSQKLWPDFSDKDLEEAIKDYSDRERRFGK